MVQKIKKGSIVWSIKHRPPLSMTIIGSILLLLMSSKGIVIDNLPLSNKEQVELLGKWYMYVIEVAGVFVAIANIALGVKKEEKS